MINVTLKGGAVKEFEPGVSPADVAKSIGMGLYKSACAARVEKAARSVPGVANAEVNLLANTLRTEVPNPETAQAVIFAVEQAGYHAERRHYPHRYAHGERRLIHVLELERELAEEHGLPDLDEGRERQHAGHDADDGNEGVAYAARLGGLFKGGLIDEPL